MKIINKYYWSLRDVLSPLVDRHIFYTTDCKNVLSSLSGDYYDVNDLPISFENPNINKLWQIVASRYIDEICFITDEESYNDQDVSNWAIKVINLIVLTQNKYLYLLDVYTAQQSHLLDRVQATNSNILRFNDTPQNVGDYEDNSHNSTVTRSETISESDTMTLMQRLKEITDNYQNLLQKWSDEFERCFIDNANI